MNILFLLLHLRCRRRLLLLSLRPLYSILILLFPRIRFTSLFSSQRQNAADAVWRTLGQQIIIIVIGLESRHAFIIIIIIMNCPECNPHLLSVVALPLSPTFVANPSLFTSTNQKGGNLYLFSSPVREATERNRFEHFIL